MRVSTVLAQSSTLPHTALQTDPIGYGDGLNWYNYAGGDPVNRTDPTGQMFIAPEADGGADEGAKEFMAIVDAYTTPEDFIQATMTPAQKASDIFSKEFWEHNARVNGHYVPSAQAHGDGDEIVVTAPRWVFDDVKWYWNGGRYALNSNYVDPAPWLNLTNVLTAQIVGYTVAAAPASDLLFARGTGLLNRNDAFRIGWGWKGSALNGSSVFRMSIGNKNWPGIPGLPTFPWHVP